ncbi:hypothetical protein [Micromonospora sp. WMMD1155]|uniref:hypothetical protein n=1 Tax=Micromonospora sp. WMMD1155 TaxID=3016094 RepID=UPI00249B414F|nr:hypothetical protein [Micromonospora sp. WMMD1155]WFE53069.1 hypothetical protein O7617_23335 [Micromonospora sp. WMMD1155]
MKVFPVALDSGQTASLRLDATTVFITVSASRWRRLLRFSAGSVLLGLGLAAVANGVTHAVNERVGLGLVVGAVALVVAGALGAAAAGALIWRAERLPTDSLSADEVSFARSDATDGRVTVTVERADGATRHFSATGTAGPRTAQLFARMLAVAASTDKTTASTP